MTADVAESLKADVVKWLTKRFADDSVVLDERKHGLEFDSSLKSSLIVASYRQTFW